MDKQQQERYVRWQDYRITQLSFSINLFLSFSVASLAYITNLKLRDDPSEAVPFDLIILLWSASATMGVVATVTRLLDYRYTAQKIKHGGKLNSIFAASCGTLTWGFFWSQTISYAMGAYFFLREVIGV